MTETPPIATLLDLGSLAIVTTMLWMVWKRLNEVTDRLLQILETLRRTEDLNVSQANLNHRGE